MTQEEAIAIVAESLEDEEVMTCAPIALVPSNDQAFDPKIFDESFRSDITSTLLRLGVLAGLTSTENAIKVGIFQQLDANGQAKSVLSLGGDDAGVGRFHPCGSCCRC